LITRVLALNLVKFIQPKGLESRMVKFPNRVLVFTFFTILCSFLLASTSDDLSLYFVKVVLVELANEAGKVRVLEMTRKNRPRKLLGIFDEKGFSCRTPAHDPYVRVGFKHPEKLPDELFHTTSPKRTIFAYFIHLHKVQRRRAISGRDHGRRIGRQIR